MDRHTEAVDVYSILKPVFFISKVFELWPYNAVGETGDHRIIVTVSATIYSIVMIVLNVGVFAYRLIIMNAWDNICSFGVSILYTGVLCQAVSG